MAAINVTPDKEYMITEKRLRFAVDAEVPPAMVPFTVVKQLARDIETFQKHRGWTFLDRVPARKQFPAGRACCEQMLAGKPGESLTIRFFPAEFQGDTDDAHNFSEMSDKTKRIQVDGKIDWIAVCHFWEPAVFVNREAEREYSRGLGEQSGFMKWDALPSDHWAVVRRRFENVEQ